MKNLKSFLKIAAALVVWGFLAGCQDGEYSGGGEYYGTVSYGVGFYDPWYYGAGYHSSAIIVAPPIRGNYPTTLPSMPRVSPRMR